MRGLLWVGVAIAFFALLVSMMREDGGTRPAGTPVAPAAQPFVQPPQFEAVLYVTASSLNLRESPSTSGRVLATLPANTLVQAGERRNGWVMVMAAGRIGWVSGDYLGSSPVQVIAPPPVQAPVQTLTRQPSQQANVSCSPRRTCGQIGSCAEARAYLAQCSWGYRLDGDSDGVPCESICP